MSMLAYMACSRAEHHCSGLDLPLGGVARQLWLHIWGLLPWQTGLLFHTAHRSAQHLSAAHRQVSWHISRVIFTASEAEEALALPAAAWSYTFWRRQRQRRHSCVRAMIRFSRCQQRAPSQLCRSLSAWPRVSLSAHTYAS